MRKKSNCIEGFYFFSRAKLKLNFSLSLSVMCIIECSVEMVSSLWVLSANDSYPAVCQPLPAGWDGVFTEVEEKKSQDNREKLP